MADQPPSGGIEGPPKPNIERPSRPRAQIDRQQLLARQEAARVRRIAERRGVEAAIRGLANRDQRTQGESEANVAPPVGAVTQDRRTQTPQAVETPIINPPENQTRQEPQPQNVPPQEGNVGDVGSTEDAANRVDQAREDLRNRAAERDEARRQQIEQLNSLTPEELGEEISSRQSLMEEARVTINTRGLPDESYRAARQEFATAQNEWQLLRSFRTQSLRNARTGGGESRQDARATAQARVNEKLEDLRRLGGMNVADLTNQGTSEQASLEAFKTMAGSSSVTQPEKDIINAQIRDSEARIKAIEQLKANKTPAEEAAKREGAVKQAAEDLTRLRGETATVEDLPYLRGIIDDLNVTIENNEGELRNLDNRIVAEKDPDRKKQLEAQKEQLVKDIVSNRERVKSYKATYKSASELVRTEAGMGSAASQDTIEDIGPDQFEKLSSEQQREHLKKLARALGRPGEAEMASIAQKIESGQNLSPKEMGQFVRNSSDRILAGDRRHVMRDLYRANAQNPEIAQAVLARVAETRAGNKALREKFPNDWQRMLDFAKKHPGWLMLLLAILAGITVAAGPGLGAAASAVGGGAGAFGASRRDWGQS